MSSSKSPFSGFTFMSEDSIIYTFSTIYTFWDSQALIVLRNLTVKFLLKFLDLCFTYKKMYTVVLIFICHRLPAGWKSITYSEKTSNLKDVSKRLHKMQGTRII